MKDDRRPQASCTRMIVFLLTMAWMLYTAGSILITFIEHVVYSLEFMWKISMMAPIILYALK